MIRPLVIVAAAAAFAGAVVVAIEGRTADELVSRRSVTTAFARVGEPLIVRIDMAQADPGSPVDVIYVPVAEDVPEPPFEVNLFEHARSAREHARLVESVAGPGTEVEQRKNVLLIYSSSVSDQRRERIVGALRSLQVGFARSASASAKCWSRGSPSAKYRASQRIAVRSYLGKPRSA